MRHSVPAARAPRLVTVVCALVLAFVVTYAVPSAQQASTTGAKKALTIDDYSKWKSISGQDLSPDGKWVAYVTRTSNVPTTETKAVLHLQNLASGQDVTVADATGNVFSSDAKWIAYSVEPAGTGRGGRGGRAGNAPAAEAPAQDAGRAGAAATPAAPRHVDLRNLATGEVKSWQDIQSFSFNANATHLLLRRRAPQGAGAANGRAGGDAAPAAGAAAAPTTTPARGVDVTVHNLATGRDQLLGSVADASFNKTGDLLAYTIDNAAKDSNGLFVMDLAANRIVPLDNDAKFYNRLQWNDAGTALAVLKGVDVDKMREKHNVLLAYTNVKAAMTDATPAAPVVLDPSKADGFPKDTVISDRAALTWSDDGQRVFFGMKAQVPAPVTVRKDADQNADLDIWSSFDERIQSQQMVRADQERNFTFREAFDVGARKFVKLADETMRDLDVAPDGVWAIGRDTRGYISDYKPAAADIYRVNTRTGERTLIAKNHLTGAGTPGISPDGKTFLMWTKNKFEAYDLNAGTVKILDAGTGPKAPGVNFTNMEFDYPGPKPSYGIAGYTSDGKSVVAQHRYDLWQVPLDGTPAKNLTNGAGTKDEIRFRYVRIEPADGVAAGGPGGGGGRGGGAGRQTIDLSKPVVLSAYGEYTKKAGFYELSNGQLKPLVYDDASFSTPVKAAKADAILYTRQTFAEFPDLRVAPTIASVKDGTQITNVNPQQADFLWGHRVLFNFKDRFGHRLQGVFALPDDYQPGQKRPMMVSFYEENASNLHRYQAPSFITGMGAVPVQAVTEGYITMMPDVHYHTGSSHSDQLDAVESAVRAMIAMGIVDPKHIGLNGHSYGGEGAAFISTRSRLFAAVGVGAAVTDLFSDFSQSWGWSYQVSGGTGANGNSYYLYEQGRWGFSPWEKPDVYHFESALTHVPEVTQPILIMHGTADPTVSFAEDMNFFNALRYNGKTATLLAYTGEGHGLSGLANKKDLTTRYMQFFNHYLKGAPAPEWLTKGVSYIDKVDKDANKIIK